jgi:23S rRNA pseudouridine1911/1915/1917 synthase
MDIEILYEDQDVIAINKPSGLVVHSDGRTKEKTVVDWFVYKYPESKGVGEHFVDKDGKEVDRSGIVHRLDRETSGVLLLAKTQKGFENLKSQFQTRDIEKEYHAFVYGKVKLDSGTIDRPIGRSGKDFRKKTAQRGSRGESLERRLQIIKSFQDQTIIL